MIVKLLPVGGWTCSSDVRAAVVLAIETILDRDLPDAYTPDLYQEKCTLIYQHIYDSYFGEGRSIYAT